MVFLSAGRNSISVNRDDSWWVPRWQSLPGAFTECNSRVKTHVFWKISYFLQIPLPPTLPQVGFSEKWGRLKSPGCSQVATRPLDSRRRGLCLQRRLCPRTPLSQSPGSQLWTQLTALQTAYFLPWKHGSTLPAASGKRGSSWRPRGTEVGVRESTFKWPHWWVDAWALGGSLFHKRRNWGSDLWTAWGRLLEDGGALASWTPHTVTDSRSGHLCASVGRIFLRQEWALWFHEPLPA